MAEINIIQPLQQALSPPPGGGGGGTATHVHTIPVYGQNRYVPL